MKSSYKLGLSFGSVSGVISTLGMMVGLESGTQSELAVIGGIIMIAIADSFSDALSMYVSEESQSETKQNFIWQATVGVFLSKLLIALTFIVPFFFFELSAAVVVNVIWGLALVALINYFIAKSREVHPVRLMVDHLLVAVLVVAVTYFAGKMIRDYLIVL